VLIVQPYCVLCKLRVEAEETVVIVETGCVLTVRYELRLEKQLYIKQPA